MLGFVSCSELRFNFFLLRIQVVNLQNASSWQFFSISGVRFLYLFCWCSEGLLPPCHSQRLILIVLHRSSTFFGKSLALSYLNLDVSEWHFCMRELMSFFHKYVFRLYVYSIISVAVDICVVVIIQIHIIYLCELYIL